MQNVTYKASHYSFLQPPVTFTLLGPIFPSALLLQISSVYILHYRVISGFLPQTTASKMTILNTLIYNLQTQETNTYILK